MLVADNAAYANLLAEPTAALIVSIAGGYDAIVAPSTANGKKNVMPRVAALLDVMQISDITKVLAPDTFERPIYAGNALQTVQSTDAKKVITVRTASFQAAGTGGSAPVEAVAAAADPGVSTFVGEEIVKSDRPELGAAKIIISGGRALGSKEAFAKVIEPVADKLGAPWAPRAPRSMPATRRTTGRSARPARSSPETLTSPWASRAPSSTSPA